MQTDTPSTPTTQDRARKLEAELIFGDQADADAAGVALRAHGFTVVERPDWTTDEPEIRVAHGAGDRRRRARVRRPHRGDHRAA